MKEENKLIADNALLISKFMGAEINGNTALYPIITHRLRLWADFEMQYHTSWDWLMPVVEKIEALGYKFEITEYFIFICPNDDNKSDKPNIGWDGKNKLDAAYNGCIQFITWYNQQPK